jgi:uncharacterized membrane protein
MNEPQADFSPPPASAEAKADPQANAASSEHPDSEYVWSFRGYRLKAGDFNTAMVHLFRAEVQRANVWRSRLDTTTNWAVITTGAALSIAFANTSNHIVILLNILLVTIFLTIEARRYRYYELWAYRVRLMETDFFAAMLVPPFHPAPDWAEALSESLLHPQFPISTLEAMGRRMRRNYLYIYFIIFTAWCARLWLMPAQAENWAVFEQRAAVGPIPGQAVLVMAAVFAGILLMIGLFTVQMQDAAGEVLPRFGAGPWQDDTPLSNVDGGSPRQAWFRPAHRRSQLLTLIITDRQQAVADCILQDMRRGVTAMPGTGMFTHQQHGVLLCALTVTEVPQLKASVAQADPNAFVVVIPAKEVLGRGFMPLTNAYKT